MHIAIIVRRLTNFGGVQRQALSLAHELKKMGHDIRLYTFAYDRERCYPELVGDIPVRALPQDEHLPTTGFFGFINETRMAKRLSKYIDSSTELLHPHCIISHHVAYFYKKNIKHIPSVWNLNELPAMRWPIEMLEMVENPEYHDIPKKPLWYKKLVILLRNAYDRFFVQKQDVITVFDTFHQKMLERYAGRKSTIVPSGLDIDRFQYLYHESPSREKKLFLLTSGIFLSYRRFEDIISALPILIEKGLDPELSIFGDYSCDKKYHKKLIELSRRLGVENRVVYKGTYLDEELMKAFAESHIFVFPHLQSQGLSVYESIAAGLPTVITPVPGTYETLHHKREVMVAEVKNPVSLAAALDELATDPTLYQTLSKDGSKYVRTNFSWRQYAEGMNAIFKKVGN